MSKLSVASFTNIGYQFHSRTFEPIDADLTGKTVLITGATGGIGLAAAKGLSRLGARLIVVGRNQFKLDAAKRAISGEVVTMTADLSLLEQTRHVAASVLESEGSLDVLVNNVGVLMPERRTTEEGLEVALATNLAGQFMLTNLLMAKLIDSAPSRVVNVTSGGMYTEALAPDDLQSENQAYRGARAYARTKRAQVVLTEMWSERLHGTGVSVHAMHPGWAKTPGVERSLPKFNRVMSPFLRSADQGADTIVWLSASEGKPTRCSGLLWFDRAVVPTHLSETTKESDADRRLLWDNLVELTGTDLETRVT